MNSGFATQLRTEIGWLTASAADGSRQCELALRTIPRWELRLGSEKGERDIPASQGAKDKKTDAEKKLEPPNSHGWPAVNNTKPQVARSLISRKAVVGTR